MSATSGAPARSELVLHPSRAGSDPVFGDPMRRRAAVAGLLSRRVAGGDRVDVRAIEVAGQGVSGTCWIVDAAWDAVDGREERRFVFRIQTAGRSFDSSRADEYGLLTVLDRHTTLRVPRPVWFEDDTSVVGAVFAVHQWSPGRAYYDLFSDGRRDAGDRRALFDQFLDAMVHLHSLDWQRLGLDRYEPFASRSGADRPADPAPRQLAFQLERLAGLAPELRPSDTMRRAIDWLADRAPVAESLTLVHGDIGPHNALIDGTKLLALLDWELASVSDPLQDVAWFTIRGRSIRDNFAQDVLGVDGFLAHYAARTGRTVDPHTIRWWQALGILRASIGRAYQKRWIDSLGGAASRAWPEAEDEALLERLTG